MSELPKPIESNPTPPNLSSAQATAESVSKEVFDREFALLKKNLEKQESLSLRIVFGVIFVFIIALAPIVIDYLRNNYERNKEYVEKIRDIEDRFSQKYYTKEQMDQYKKDSEDVTNVIGCIRSKGFFSMNCFHL